MLKDISLHQQPNDTPLLGLPTPDRRADHHIRIDLEPLTGQQRLVYLPACRQMVPYNGTDREVWSVEVAGLRVEADSLAELEARVGQLIAALVNFSRLPSYVFFSTYGSIYLPVYVYRGELVATDHGGPTFRTRDLARLCRYVTDYFRLIGRLRADERLEIAVISPLNMAVQWPAFAVEEMAHDETSLNLSPQGDVNDVDAMRAVPASRTV